MLWNGGHDERDQARPSRDKPVTRREVPRRVSRSRRLVSVEAGSGSATLGVPSSPGVPSGTAADTLVADYNDLQSVRNLFEERNGQIAAVIVEPVAGNMGCIPPIPGFLGGLRKLCDDAGTLLVFDEVMTGFRVGPAGAQELYGITPDLTTLGKVIGGGLPIGAYGGGEKLMRMVAPDGPVYQAGTLSGNPIAVAAGLATLKTIQADGTVYDHLVDCGAKLAAGFDELATRLGMPLCWNGVGGMGSLFFSEGPVVGWSSAADGDESSFNLFFHGMLEAGIHLPPSRFEAWFWSNAHRSEDIERTIEVAERVLTRAGGASYA